jgi:non-ribosomal peptide synthetase component F
VTTAPTRAGAVVAPLSFAQESLWLIDVTAPGSPTYNVPLLTTWREPVDPAALGLALGHVVARHEVLRTTYRLQDDRPVQVVGDPAPVDVEVLDVTADPGARAAVDTGVRHRARMPFDLAHGPVLRCTAWLGAPGGDVVLLVVHHIAIDGWSLVPLHADLEEAYRAVLAGEPPNLPPLPVQYSDFASWDRATADHPTRRLQLSARAEELARSGAELLLDGARPVPAAPEGERPGRQERFPLAEALWTEVLDTARTLRATPFVVLHAAFQAVLAHRSGREEFVVGAVTANRSHPDVEPLVGFFVNTVPIGCLVRPEWTFRELCAYARSGAYRSLTHQSIPFDRLTSEVAAVREGGHTRLVDVCFALQNATVGHREPTRWSRPEVVSTGTAKFDLLLQVEEVPDGVVVTIEHDTDRYPDEVARGVVDDFLTLLAAVTADPDVPLRAVPAAAQPAAADPASSTPVRDVPTASAVIEDAVVPTPSAAGSTPSSTTGVGDLRAAELFAEALGTIDRRALDTRRGRIEATANFFALGGHSLLAVTMLAKASRLHGIAVSPRDFLADPTVAGLARLLAAPTAPQAPAAAAAEADDWPATAVQQRFWFLDRVPALRTAYLLPTVVELRDAISPDVLRAAVDDVLARHPGLRSRFALNRRARQVRYRTDGPPAACAVTDAAGWSPQRLRDHVAVLCWTGFDLAADAPARAEVIRVGDDRTLLVLVVHHAVADGWSRELLVEQIAQAHDARISGTRPELAAPVHPSAVPRTASEQQTAELVAWLRGAPVDVELPHDRPRPEVQSTAAATVSVELGRDLTAGLRDVAAGSACTTFMVTAALLAVALARLGEQQDFVFAFPWGGRDAPGSAEAVAMLVNTVVLRVDLREARTWRNLLAGVAESAAVSYRNADASFDELAAALHPDRDLSRPPVTPVFLSAQDGPAAPPGFAAARYLPLDPLHVKYELELTATDHPQALELTASYAVGLFDDGTASSLLGLLADAAADLVTNPDEHPLAQKTGTAET